MMRLLIPAIVVGAAILSHTTIAAQEEVEPTPQSTAGRLAATIQGTLLIDANANGVADAGDAPAGTLVVLVPWIRNEKEPAPFTGGPQGVGSANVFSDVSPVILLFAADDGTFRFDNVPVGTYTLQVWWESGFVEFGTAEAPHIVQAIVRVDDAGQIVAPDSLPAEWPGTFGAPLDVAKDKPILGRTPDVILLKKAPRDVVQYPVSTGFTTPIDGGRADVASILSTQPEALPEPVQLPRESDEAGAAAVWFVVAGLSLMLVCGVGGVVLKSRHKRERGLTI